MVLSSIHHMRLQHVCVFLIVLTFSWTGLKAQEVISTWPFAEKIGWRGLQTNFGASGGGVYVFRSLDHLKSVSNPEHYAKIDQLKHNPASVNTHKVMQVYGIFVPFRNAKNYWISATEWQTGLEFQLDRQNEEIIQPVYGSFEAKNNSLLWKNRLLFQQKFLSPNIKIYAGPMAGISLMPGYSFKIGKYAPNSKAEDPTYNEQYVLSSARFILAGGFAAGLKINLSCRFNFHFDYEYQAAKYMMDKGALDFTMHGFALGVTYKFMKPDPITGEETSPFW